MTCIEMGTVLVYPSGKAGSLSPAPMWYQAIAALMLCSNPQAISTGTVPLQSNTL